MGAPRPPGAHDSALQGDGCDTGAPREWIRGERPWRTRLSGHPAPPPAHSTDTSNTGGTHFAFVRQPPPTQEGRGKLSTVVHISLTSLIHGSVGYRGRVGRAGRDYASRTAAGGGARSRAACAPPAAPRPSACRTVAARRAAWRTAKRARAATRRTAFRTVVANGKPPDSSKPQTSSRDVGRRIAAVSSAAVDCADRRRAFAGVSRPRTTLHLLLTESRAARTDHTASKTNENDSLLAIPHKRLFCSVVFNTVAIERSISSAVTGLRSPPPHSHRCNVMGCPKSAVRSTDTCIAHGGGLRCQHMDASQVKCDKSAQGATGLCKAHGGGRRCLQVQCKTKDAAAPHVRPGAQKGVERQRDCIAAESCQGSHTRLREMWRGWEYIVVARRRTAANLRAAVRPSAARTPVDAAAASLAAAKWRSRARCYACSTPCCSARATRRAAAAPPCARSTSRGRGTART